MGRFFFFFKLLVLFFVTQCAHVRHWPHQSSKYESFVSNHIKEKKLHNRGRVVLHVKVLKASHELKKLQEELSPGFSFKENKEATQYILAITVTGREPMTASDLIFEINGTRADAVSEITDQNLVETLYGFAFPYHRVFLVNFSPQHNTGTLKVNSTVGSVTFDIGAIVP